MKKLTRLAVGVLGGIAVLFLFSLLQVNKENDLRKPLAFDEVRHENGEDPDKFSVWSPEEAAEYQKKREKYMPQVTSRLKSAGAEIFAGGALSGTWYNRGPYNVPGAFKFAEMLDGTDTIYTVTWNHYAGEYNSRSYIFRGTVYNPTTQTGGDDFVRLTPHWPNRYSDLIALKVGGTTRLIAGIENGPVYYSDNQGAQWTMSSGTPAVALSTIANRQDNNRMYTTDGQYVYSSSDGGASFTQLQDFGAPSSNAVLYSPRYAVQQDASSVYFYREGSFYLLSGNSFVLQGSIGITLDNTQLSIGGDSRRLYVTGKGAYYTSTDQGATWDSRSPEGTYYDTPGGIMSAGEFIAVHPEGPDTVIGGYTVPNYSHDGLQTTMKDGTGWGHYQQGPTNDTSAYFNHIRFNYHPDFQSSHFFYNANNQLFSVRCSDGGVYVSYKEWRDLPIGGSIDNSGYENAHFIDITTLGTVTALIYRGNLATGHLADKDVIFSTQDQGSQNLYNDTDNEVYRTYQAIGGDGYPIGGYGGVYMWRWVRYGDEIYAPVEMYDYGYLRSASGINEYLGTQPKVTFTRNTSASIGWPQVYFDQADPDANMWILAKSLDRASWDGSSLTQQRISLGVNQVTALAQSSSTPAKMWLLQDGKVYASADRGRTFGPPVVTPFAETLLDDNIGRGVVLPTDDNWILFAGPSSNETGAILSKDGGSTWLDVTGDFPSGSDAQTAGMVATPEGKFVFAGTDVGPYVFVVAEEKWYPLGASQNAAYFNTTDMAYLPTSKTVRFATFGSGIWDFKINDNNSTSLTNTRENSAAVTVKRSLSSSLALSVTNAGTYRVMVCGLDGRVFYTKELFLNEESLEISLPSSRIGHNMVVVTVSGNGLYHSEKLLLR